MSEWLTAQLDGILFFLCILLGIGLTNLVGLRRLEEFGAPERFPRVVVLLPARNEQANIRECVESLLAQDYAHFEIIALDDDSSDDTGAILNELAAANPQVRVLQGKPLPSGWFGKHWACHQLAQATEAELLLFTDADTRHHPQALGNAVAALSREEADLVTALPHERVESWGEKLSVPLLGWSIFCFLPVALAQRLRLPPFSAAIGQFMLFRRTAYEVIGGHAAVRQNIADDLALGRRIIGRGLRWRLVDATGRVECRMYRSSREAFDGISRSLFAAFDYRVWLFVPIWVWLGIVFLAPLATALTGDGRAFAAIGLSLVLWGMYYARFRLPLYLTFLYPLSMGMALLIAFRSMILTMTGRVVWKGRALARMNPR